VTDAVDNYEFKGVKPGDYLLRLQAAEFEPFSALLRVPVGATIVQNITAKLTGITQKIEVTEQTAEFISTSSSSGPKLTEKQLAALPLVEENLKNSLPLTPGVVRTRDGKLNFRGSSEEQSMLQANDAQVTDPVTSSFTNSVSHFE